MIWMILYQYFAETNYDDGDDNLEKHAIITYGPTTSGYMMQIN